jgi:hypothetical protein
MRLPRLRNRGSTRAVDGETAAHPRDAAVPPRPARPPLGTTRSSLGIAIAFTPRCLLLVLLDSDAAAGVDASICTRATVSRVC